MSFSLLDIIKDIPDVVILDIGSAFHNEKLKTDYQALINVRKVRVIGFDPDTTHAEGFEKKYDGKHRFYPYIIGDGKLGKFHENCFSQTSSLYPTNHELVDLYQNLGQELMVTLDTSAVETNRLDDLRHLEGMQDVDAIYIDIQGAELDTLSHATRVLSDVVLLHTEVEFIELYKDQPLFADIDVFMRNGGFMFHKFMGIGKRALKPLVLHNNVNKGIQHLWSDAVYVRDILKLEKLSDEKLLKLALIVNDVYLSIDLCYYVLEILDQRNNTTIAADYFDALVGDTPSGSI